MPFRLVKGQFVPGEGVPDGDSVKFRPLVREFITSLPGVRMGPNATSVQLRYEGIDALEKHAMQAARGRGA